MKKFSIIVIAFSIIGISGCSKKSHPSKNASIIYKEDGSVSKTGEPEKSNPPPKPLTPKQEKALFPETIYVNDAAAKKSVDGRLYYDVEGHRYWKNYKDGKYYLFNKSMYNNPDFTPPKKSG